MLKKISYLLIAPAFLFACGETESTETEAALETIQEEVVELIEDNTPKPPKSPRIENSGMVNGVKVSIAFGSPFVKGRAIWGELVSYDKIWRAGANDATAITFENNVMINDSEVAAGTYALFIIPEEGDSWTVILNEEWSKEEHGVWGAYDHKPEKDVLRFEVSPTFGEEVTESLTFDVTETGVMFAWEKASFSFDIMAK